MNSTPKDDIKSKLHYLYEALATDSGLSRLELFKLLFLIIYYKRISDTCILDIPKGCRWDDIVIGDSETLVHNIIDNLRRILGQYNELYHALYAFNLLDIYEHSKQIDSYAPYKIFQVINEFNLATERIDIFEFDSVITFILEHSAKRTSRNSPHQPEIGYLFTPTWLEKLLANMLAPKTNETLYFPFSGSSSIVSAFVKYIKEVNASGEQGGNPFLPLSIQCMDSNLLACAIAKLRLALMGGMTVDIIHGNPFSSSAMPLHDVICGLPPFGYFRNELPAVYSIGRDKFEIPRKRKEVAFLLQALNQLSKKGRLGIIIPFGLLFDETLRKIRRSLIEENYVEAVVQLPEDSFTPNFVKTVLLILNKNRSHEKKSTVAMGVLPTSITKNTTLNDEVYHFLAAYKKNELSENLFFASMEEIQQQDYNLSPIRYVGAANDEMELLLRDKKGRRLEDICQFVRGRARRPIEDPSGVPFISTKDLSGEVTDPYLNFENVVLSASQADNHIVNQKCILISLVGRSPKPTIFAPERALRGAESTDTFPGILPNGNVVCLIPNENFVDFEYFYYQLTTSLFLRQYEKLSKGVGIPNVSLKDLRSAIVPVLPLTEQREVTRQLKEALLREANAKLEAIKANLNLEAKKQEAEFGIVRLLTHNLRHKITDIQSSLTHIEIYLKEKGLLGDFIQEKLSIDDQVETLGEVIGKSLSELKHMHNLLEKTRDLIVKEINVDGFKSVNLVQLLKQKITPKTNSKNFTINITGKIKSEIYLDETYFLEMISNLIKNAEIHGFTDTARNYEIRFDLSENPQYVFIDYSNNGDPLPSEFNIESFYGYGVKRFDSPGEGLGGAFIEKVIKAHKGDMLIISRNPVHFRIMIPKGEGNEQGQRKAVEYLGCG